MSIRHLINLIKFRLGKQHAGGYIILFAKIEYYKTQYCFNSHSLF